MIENMQGLDVRLGTTSDHPAAASVDSSDDAAAQCRRTAPLLTHSTGCRLTRRSVAVSSAAQHSYSTAMVRSTKGIARRPHFG